MYQIPSTKALAEALVTHEGADPEQAELAAGMILDSISWRDGQGRSHENIRELVAKHKASFSSFYVRPMPAPISEAKADDVDVEAAPPLPQGFRPARSAEERVSAAVASASRENPWSKASLNVTHQAMLEARAPELAAKLKAAARG